MDIPLEAEGGVRSVVEGDRGGLEADAKIGKVEESGKVGEIMLPPLPPPWPLEDNEVVTERGTATLDIPNADEVENGDAKAGWTDEKEGTFKEVMTDKVEADELLEAFECDRSCVGVPLPVPPVLAVEADEEGECINTE